MVTTAKRRDLLRELTDRLGGLDTRSLAIFRILIGLISALDALNRLPDTMTHYADSGAVPRYALLEHYSRDAYISLHMASGSESFQSVLLAAHVGFAAMLFLGYRTKLATAACWFLTISIHIRNPLVLHGGDVVIRTLLFWGMFLPLGARLSLDSHWSRRVPAPPVSFVGVGALGFIAQLAFIYLFAYWLKTGDPWKDGTALWYALNVDHFVKQPQASMLLARPELLALLTKAVMRWECLAPIALLVPFAQGPLRTVLVGGFICLHLGFFTFMELGLFPWSCIVAWLAVLPGWFWDKLGWEVGSRDIIRAPIVQNVVAAFFLYFITHWNLTTLPGADYAVPANLRWVARVMRLDQKWDMFAPYPLTDDGWWVVPGKLRDGSEVELLRGGEVLWEKPEEISSLYGGQRRHKYMRNLWVRKWSAFRPFYGRYRCRSWNAGKLPGDPDSLHSFVMYFMKETTNRPGEEPALDRVLVWSHRCYSSGTSR